MATETINPDTFDFGFENFRAMGFTYTGRVISAKIDRPAEGEMVETVDRKTGATLKFPKKPQLVVLIDPTDHVTKSGNPYPEYMTLTHNVRSKLGIFIEHCNKLGIKFSTDPSILEGMHLEWEVKEVDFGSGNPTRVNVPIGIVQDALPSNNANGARVDKPFTDEELRRVADAIRDVPEDERFSALAANNLGDSKFISGLADGSLLRELESAGLLVAA